MKNRKAFTSDKNYAEYCIWAANHMNDKILEYSIYHATNNKIFREHFGIETFSLPSNELEKR